MMKAMLIQRERKRQWLSRFSTALLLGVAVGGLSSPVIAAENGKKPGGSLASQATNPAAPLMQLQLQDLYTPESENSSGYANSAIIQPVVPFVLGKDHYFQSIIARLTVPAIVSTPKPDATGKRRTGTGDSTLLVVPARHQPVGKDGDFWNFGPVLSLVAPTASHDETGSGKWSAGPGGLLIKNTNNVFTKGDSLLLGVLSYHTWSFAGESDRADVSKTFGQPIVVYHFNELFGQKGWYTGTPDDLWIYDWKENETFQVSVGARLGRVFTIGKQPINVFLQSWYNPVESDEGASPNYTLKLNVTFLFPE